MVWQYDCDLSGQECGRPQIVFHTKLSAEIQTDDEVGRNQYFAVDGQIIDFGNFEFKVAYVLSGWSCALGFFFRIMSDSVVMRKLIV